MFNVFCKENKRYGWVFTFKAKFWHDFWDNMIMYRTYLIHVCVRSTSYRFSYTCCKSKSSIWFIIFLSFIQYFIFTSFSFMSKKYFLSFSNSYLSNFLHVRYFTYLMFNVLWFCDIFTSIVTCEFALSPFVRIQNFLFEVFFEKTILTRHETWMSISTE